VNLSRSIRLPDGVGGENISAAVENGILTVTIPQPPTKQPQKIKVN
jgi:HSP20 family molecular chaperone IbpA